MVGSSATPQRRKRENNYLGKIGEQGRKTGLTLPEFPRDEYGMEATTNLFTSPAKSAKSTKSARSARKSNATITTSESMELEERAPPNKPPVLSTRADKLKRPVPARSPFRKTHIGATPVRHPSLDPRSSPGRFSSPVSQRSVSRLLDFSEDEPISSTERPNHTQTLPPSPENDHSATNRGRDIYSLSNSPLAAVRRTNGTRTIVDLASPQDDGLPDDDDAPLDTGDYSDSDNEPLLNGDYSDDENEADGDEEDQTEIRHASRQAAMPPPPPRPRGNPPRSARSSDISQVSARQVQAANSSQQPQPKRRGRPPKNSKPTASDEPIVERDDGADAVGVASDNDSVPDPGLEPEEEPMYGIENVDAEDVAADDSAADDSEGENVDGEDVEDEDVEGDDQGENQAAASEAEPDPQAAKKSMSKRGRPRKVNGADKESNARRKPAKEPRRKAMSKSRDEQTEAGAPRGVRATSVPMQRERQLTPDGDDGATHTRSGRLAYKPLAYWKNERLRYDNDGAHGMQTIKNIIRMEERTPPKRTQKKQGGGRRKRVKSADAGDGDNEEDVEPEPAFDEVEEPWEADEGVVRGDVRVWDAEIATSLDDVSETDIAYAGNRLDAREVTGAKFRYAKTLTMPFFGSGVVEIPPRGYKRMKNSRKMQMVFFVHYGKVLVEVSSNRFTISKGGVWQVPRGNFYSITNETDHEARIFFAQGCEQPVEQLGSQSRPE